MLAGMLAGCTVVACERSAPRASIPDETHVQSDTLALAIDAPRQVMRGDAVTIALTARNTSGRVIDLYLRGREPTALVTISDEQGDIVWRNIGTGVPAILLLRTLEPDDTLTITEHWQPAADIAPGAYTINAELLGEIDAIPFPQHVIDVRR
jgi:hypothetical protein